MQRPQILGGPIPAGMLPRSMSMGSPIVRPVQQHSFSNPFHSQRFSSPATSNSDILMQLRQLNSELESTATMMPMNLRPLHLPPSLLDESDEESDSLLAP